MSKTKDFADQALLRQASAGSQAAIRSLHRRHNDKLVLMVRDDLLISTVDARTAVTEAWRRLGDDENRAALAEIADIRGWLFRSACRAAERFIVPGTAAWTRKRSRLKAG
jgi:hypothetical protein